MIPNLEMVIPYFMKYKHTVIKQVICELIDEEKSICICMY